MKCYVLYLLLFLVKRVHHQYMNVSVCIYIIFFFHRGRGKEETCVLVKCFKEKGRLWNFLLGMTM